MSGSLIRQVRLSLALSGDSLLTRH
jgi:hypothetical protein